MLARVLLRLKWVYSQIKIPIYVIVSDFCIMYIEDGSHLPEQMEEGEVKGQRE